jgi:hypothetical protein
MAKAKAKDYGDWKASIFVPGAPRDSAAGSGSSGGGHAETDPSVETHSIRSFVFGSVETGEPGEMKDQWQKTVALVMDMTSSLDEKARGWHIDEVEVGLTLSAKGELLFIAEAGAEASIKVTLSRK